MNIKFLTAVCTLVLFFSCKKTQEATVEGDTITNKNKGQDIIEKDLAKLKYTDFNLDKKTEDVIKDWAEYYQLQDVINNVKKGDLSFFDDNKKDIKTLLRALKKNVPKDINNPFTLARITALETKLYKLESVSNLSPVNKQELIGVIKEFLVSFSNLNFQMNKKIEKEHQNIQKP